MLGHLVVWKTVGFSSTLCCPTQIHQVFGTLWCPIKINRALFKLAQVIVPIIGYPILDVRFGIRMWIVRYITIDAFWEAMRLLSVRVIRLFLLRSEEKAVGKLPRTGGWHYLFNILLRNAEYSVVLYSWYCATEYRAKSFNELYNIIFGSSLQNITSCALLWKYMHETLDMPFTSHAWSFLYKMLHEHWDLYVHGANFLRLHRNTHCSCLLMPEMGSKWYGTDKSWQVVDFMLCIQSRTFRIQYTYPIHTCINIQMTLIKE